MKIKITTRLFLMILLATVLAVASFVLLLRWDLDRTFIRHLNVVAQATVTTLQEEVESYYGRKGTWRELEEKPEIWAKLLYDAVKDSQYVMDFLRHPGPDGPERRDRKRPHRDRDGDNDNIRPFGFNILLDHFVLLDRDRNFIVGRRDMKVSREFNPIRSQGEVVGYIGFVPTRDLLNKKQQRFLRDIQDTLLGLGGIIILLSALLAMGMARKVVRPIKDLATGTHKLAAGDLTARVRVPSKDEIGTLADDFNHLAFTLEKNEQARRQWMAEISHELRTPVAVLRGEIEALQDGIRPTDKNALASLHAEAVHLGRLADDLYQLAMSDVGTLTYHREELDLCSLLDDVCISFEELFEDVGVELQFNFAGSDSIAFFGDDSRLRQLFDNLLDNALKYTDPGGQVRVALTSSEQKAIIDFQDSAPGVERDELEKLLDRFYRSPKNSRSSGGAGLGLSICRNIVEGHQGTMSVQNAPLGGLWVRVELPIRESLS